MSKHARLIARASLTGPIVAVMLVLMATSVSAAPAQPKVHVRYAAARLQFTDCPLVITGETDCLGGDVSEGQYDKHVGNQQVHRRELTAGVAAIHITSTGEVQVGPTLGFGVVSLKVVDIDGLREAHMHADVPFSDGTTARVDVDLQGFDDELPFPAQISQPEPLCPDGWADMTVNPTYRAADPGDSTLTFHGIQMVPTSASFGPFLLQGTESGTCTSAP